MRSKAVRLRVEVGKAHYSTDYFHVVAVPVYIDSSEPPQWQVKRFSDTYYNGESQYADLEIRAQGDLHKDTPVYAWKIEYQPYSVDLRRAQVMVKTLRRIERRMDTLTDNLGYPEDFAQYLARAGQVIGALNYGFGDQGNFEWVSARLLAPMINERITQLRGAAGVVAA